MRAQAKFGCEIGDVKGKSLNPSLGNSKGIRNDSEVGQRNLRNGFSGSIFVGARLQFEMGGG
jgi:hypothetical protein